VAARCRFLEILASMGGPTALAAVGAAAKDATPEIREAASRLLGEWMDVDAAPVLLDLAKTATEEKYKVRTLRGYIRLVRSSCCPTTNASKCAAPPWRPPIATPRRRWSWK